MLTVRDHGVDDYADLHDMDATDVGTLSEDDRACLADVGRFLVESGNADAIRNVAAAQALRPTDGEVFVESVVHSGREIKTAPVQRSDCNALDMTAVRLDDRCDSGLSVVGMEFASAADFGDTSPLSAEDDAALSGIAAPSPGT